jgi:hypothetical protein
MNTNSKLQLFRSLVQNQSLADLKQQVGHEGIELIQRIAEACARRDSSALLQHVDRYLVLASATPRAIDIGQAELRPEAFNDIRDAIGPILEEISISFPSADPDSDATKPQNKQMFKRLRLHLPRRRKPTA